jgi:1,4-alpha-glucan branching enzyme
MKKFAILFLMFLTSVGFSQVQNITYSVAPNPFSETTPITITVNGSSLNLPQWSVFDNSLYLWAWSTDLNYANQIDCPTNGSWTASSAANKFTYNSSNNTFTFTLTPTTFFNRTNIGRIGFLVKALNGTGDKKSQDILVNVGSFQSTLVSPAENSNSILVSGSNLSISANNTNGVANYLLQSNGVTLSSANAVTSFSFNHLSLTTNQNYLLTITQGTSVITKKFTVLINAVPVSEALPLNTNDGINYGSDPTKAILVLNAPYKDFVYVAGSFNNYTPTSAFAMKKDPTSGKFWIEITGLVANQINTYQYWVGDMTDRPANSPALVKTADPFSTLVLSPFDDPEIATLGVFPSLPTYPAGQEREVSVLQTGSNGLFAFNWSAATTNFIKPKKKDLVFYEILVRDFDSNRTFQDLINRINYFRDLKINAIKIMPVMEFEGNLSWGYNTVYHMALDKRYGPPAKLKEFVDLCHQNGIAVLLDIALNHVFGRSPLERMWMLDTDNDGWGNGISSENPYCNLNAMHSYNVGSDLNHFINSGVGANMTTTYVKRTIEHWIKEYKIDGYRWDLTKGFTNLCPSNVSGGQEPCTNNYQPDRVQKMKDYADIQWAADTNSLVVFEHLGVGGSYNEEVEWANYKRNGDVGGIMQWRKMTDPYANLLKGQAVNLSGVADATDRFVGYAESHDEERVVYKALNEAGQTQGNLAKVLQRMPAMGSVLFLVPGPKMIWHFSDLGWERSLWTCTNNTVSFSNPDCKLDTKPQPQWANNWMTDVARKNIYDTWAKLINLKINENVFENGQYAWNFNDVGRPRLDVWTTTSPSAALSYAFVLTNFSDNTVNVAGGFPFNGNWVNLMDNTVVNVTSGSQNVTIEPGGFRVFGNNASLSNQTFNSFKMTLMPNPVNDSFRLNLDLAELSVYNTTGQFIKKFSNVASDFDFNVSELQKGIYFVKATDLSGNVSNTKFIKQ